MDAGGCQVWSHIGTAVRTLCQKHGQDLADPLPVREPRLPQVHGLPVDVNGMLPRLKAPVYAVCREVVVK